MLKVDYITNTVFNSKTYILSEVNSDNVWLVDCGDIPPIISKLGKKTLKGVFLTHAHFDHIYGLPELLLAYPFVPIYTNDYGKRALASDKLNMSRYNGNPLVIRCENVKIVHDGDLVGPFKIFETPGHNPSCLCFQDDQFLFTGDAYIPEMSVVTSLPKGNKEMASESKMKILRLGEGRAIYPGHQV